MIAFFEKHKFKVVISLDGPAFIHDELRKGLPHYKVIDVINKKTNIRNKLMINCTYTKYHEENIGTNKLYDYFQKLGVKYEINNVITDNVDMQLANIKNQSEEQCIIETYEKSANKPLEFKENMYCNAIIEALVEHIYKEKFCYELCSEYGITFKADGKKILCNSFNDIENYNYAEAMNLNSKSHKECLDCWARGMCVECVANHMLDRKNIPYGSDGCKKKKKYAFALEKIVEIMYYDEEKFQKIINNYYNYR